MLTHDAEFLRGMRALADEHGAYLVADEVATGIGRTGRMWAVEHADVVPDLLTCGKGLTAGYLPLSAVLATEDIYESFLGGPSSGRTFFHGHSYTANPLCAAAAIANLDLMSANHTVARAAALGDLIGELTSDLAAYDGVVEIRRIGTMTGIEVRGVGERTGFAVCRKARERGVLVRPLGDVVVLMPPLAIGRRRPAHARVDGERLHPRGGPVTHPPAETDRVVVSGPGKQPHDESRQGVVGRLGDVAQARLDAGLRRQLSPRPPDSALLDLAGNDYLGLARDPRVVRGRRRRGTPMGRRLDRVAPGHRHHRGPRGARGVARRSPRHRRGARALVRLPRQPRGDHRAGGPRRPRRERRAQPRVDRRRVPALACRRRGGAPPESRRGREGAREPLAAKRRRGHRRGLLRRRRQSPTSPSCPTSAPDTTPCSSSTRRTRSAWSARAAAGRRTRPVSRGSRTSCSRPRCPRRSGPRAASSLGHRAVIDHLIDTARAVHLRHRARSRSRRCRTRRARRRARRPVAAGACPRPRARPRPRRHRGRLGGVRPGSRRHLTEGRPARTRGRGPPPTAPRSASTSAASGHRRCPTASRGCASPRAPTSPTTTSRTSPRCWPRCTRHSTTPMLRLIIWRLPGPGSRQMISLS